MIQNVYTFTTKFRTVSQETVNNFTALHFMPFLIQRANWSRWLVEKM